MAASGDRARAGLVEGKLTPVRPPSATIPAGAAEKGAGRDRRSSRLQLTSASEKASPRTLARRRSREREDIEAPSLLRVLRQILHQPAPAVGRGLVAGVEIVRDDGAGPAPDAREDGHVLLVVGTAEGDRLADDPGLRLPLPEELAG